MTWWPGWDSIANTGYWAHFWFWFGIVCLFALGASEIVSHVYGLRKDELVAAAESAAATQRQNDADAAEIRRKADVDGLQKQLATAQKTANEAEKKAAEARKDQAQRRLSPEQQSALVTALSPFRGQKVTITSNMGDGDGDVFKGDFVSVLDRAGWDHNGDNGISQSVIMPTPSGVQVTMNEAEARAGRVPNAAAAFVNSLLQLGITNSKTMFVNNDVPVGEIRLIVGNRPRL